MTRGLREIGQLDNSIAQAEVEELRKEVNRLRHELELLDDPETICSFGQMTFDGDGVEKDYVQAVTWYTMAAEKGNARAQHNLALMYENGQGVTRDLAEAARWYQMAADQGHAGSQNDLEVLYESGDGVSRDCTVVHMICCWPRERGLRSETFFTEDPTHMIAQTIVNVNSPNSSAKK